MKLSLTEKLLILIADLLDFNTFLSWRSVNAIPDHPRFHYHRKWINEYLINKTKKQQLYNAFKSLKRRGFLQEKILKNARGYILSEKSYGRVLFLKTKILNKQKLGDNKWLMVIFDIPEKYRKKRDFFRLNLHELGFEQLQKSVWVTPYDVKNNLLELIKFGNLEKFVKFLIVEEIKKMNQ